MISKWEETIIQGDWCYTLFQTLFSDKQHLIDIEFLKEIITSNYHFWQGDKFEDGITWTFSDEKGQNIEYKNVKTFGLYDNNDIKPSDYKAISSYQLEDRLTSFILQETDDHEYETKIKTLLQSYKNPSMKVYQFLPDQLEKSKLSVYSYFIAFILLDKELRKAVRIEFGQD